MSTLRGAIPVALVAALAGASAAGSVAWGLGVARSEQAPLTWFQSEETAPYMSPATMGELDARPDAWSIARYGTRSPPGGQQSVELDVELPDSGELFVGLSESGPMAAPGLLLRPSGVEGVWRKASSSPAALSCEGGITPSKELHLRLERSPEGFVARVGDEELRCTHRGVQGRALFASGLRRVRLSDVVLDGQALPPPVSGPALGGVALGGALGALLIALAERRSGLGSRLAVAGWIPLLLAFPLARADLASLAESMRLPGFPLPWVPLMLLGGLGFLFKLLVHAARVEGLGSRARLLLGGGLWSLGALAMLRGGGGWPVLEWLAVGGAALLAGRLLRKVEGPSPAGALAAMAMVGAPVALACTALEQPWARLYVGLAAACLGALVWLAANASRLRLYNLASLLVFAASLASLEQGIRFTDAGRFWDTSGFHGQSADSMSTLIDQFEALDAGVPTTYPIAGYPVALPPRSTPLRVACLGGSSTAGAWQNDDIAEFYPADLDRLLGPDVEVVNQGVGAWNSFHIARFLEKRGASLEADVWTFYLGVNEAVRTPRSYPELYADWQAGELSAAPPAVGNLRLFTGLRLAARGLRGNVAAVDPEQFQDNLEAIVGVAGPLGIKVLLLSEGAQPRPEAFEPYTRVMRALAEGEDVAFFDSAAALHEARQSAFLDTNHLSRRGHSVLAERLAAELRRLGWTQAAQAADPG